MELYLYLQCNPLKGTVNQTDPEKSLGLKVETIK